MRSRRSDHGYVVCFRERREPGQYAVRRDTAPGFVETVNEDDNLPGRKHPLHIVGEGNIVLRGNESVDDIF